MNEEEEGKAQRQLVKEAVIGVLFGRIYDGNTKNLNKDRFNRVMDAAERIMQILDECLLATAPCDCESCVNEREREEKLINEN